MDMPDDKTPPPDAFSSSSPKISNGALATSPDGARVPAASASPKNTAGASPTRLSTPLSSPEGASSLSALVHVAVEALAGQALGEDEVEGGEEGGQEGGGGPARRSLPRFPREPEGALPADHTAGAEGSGAGGRRRARSAVGAEA